VRGPITPARPIPLRARANAHFRPPVQRSVRACAAPHPRLLPGSADAAPRRRNQFSPCKRNKERAGEGSDYASPAKTFAGKNKRSFPPRRRKESTSVKEGCSPKTDCTLLFIIGCAWAKEFSPRLTSAASLIATASAPESRFHSCNQAFPYAGPPSRAFPGRAPVHNQSRAAIRCRCGPTRFAALAEIHPPR
jgi:hypothetical protein